MRGAILLPAGENRRDRSLRGQNGTSICQCSQKNQLCHATHRLLVQLGRCLG